MKILRPLLGLLLATCLPANAADKLDPTAIKTALRRAFDWQATHPTTEKPGMKRGDGIDGWVRGAFMTGVLAAAQTTKDTAYTDYAWAWARKCHWKPGPNILNADHLVVTQSFLDLYRLDPKRADLHPTIAAFDQLVGTYHYGADLLWWCDSLFMLPPALTRLSVATGNPRYRTEMERLYWESSHFLFDPKEHLYSRDKRFMPETPGFQPMIVEKNGTKVPCLEKNGRKMFWSRGNSWVLAGLARLMDDLPASDPERKKFEHRFQELAARVLELRPADGLWRMGLLDPDAYPHGEASGTAFFTFAFAWGIEHHLLDRSTYLPAVEKSWAAVLACQKPDGMLGYVQRIGAAPDALSENDSQEYGTGAFLLAGSELLKLTTETGGGGGNRTRE